VTAHLYVEVFMRPLYSLGFVHFYDKTVNLGSVT
jgi:hypothetical protein